MSANGLQGQGTHEESADAVINIAYDRGIGLTTWGYMDAKGTAVKFTE